MWKGGWLAGCDKKGAELIKEGADLSVSEVLDPGRWRRRLG